MRDTENENVLFISHTAADEPFAPALEGLIYAAVESKSLIKGLLESHRLSPAAVVRFRQVIGSSPIALQQQSTTYENPLIAGNAVSAPIVSRCFSVTSIVAITGGE